MMTKQIEEMIKTLIEMGSEPDEYDEIHAEGVERVTSFEEAGIMTSDKGMVIQMENGSEFQVTIVQSR